MSYLESLLLYTHFLVFNCFVRPYKFLEIHQIKLIPRTISSCDFYYVRSITFGLYDTTILSEQNPYSETIIIPTTVPPSLYSTL